MDTEIIYINHMAYRTLQSRGLRLEADKDSTTGLWAVLVLSDFAHDLTKLARAEDVSLSDIIISKFRKPL